jgi:hypothetical protein
MSSQRQPKLAYIVLPPGHGKTTRHGTPSYLLEADTLVPCRSTPTLNNLRTEAKKTNTWEEYDKEWARLLKEALGEQKAIIMVPSQSVGEALGAKFLGTGVLIEEVWEQNLSSRGDSAEKFRWSYDPIINTSYYLAQSNADLSQWILSVCEEWNSQQ